MYSELVKEFLDEWLGKSETPDIVILVTDQRLCNGIFASRKMLMPYKMIALYHTFNHELPSKQLYR